MESWIKNPELAPQGRLQLEWAERNMPVLVRIREKYRDKKPLEGALIAACLHVTKETGVLVRVLRDLGAKVMLAASNPLSTQDDVAAALAEEGIIVRAIRGETPQQYFDALRYLASAGPDIVIDDGADPARHNAHRVQRKRAES